MRTFTGKDAAMFLSMLLVFLRTVSAQTDLQGPYFVTKGANVSAVVGENVTLACVVGNTGSDAVIWKSMDVILSFDRLLVRKDPRLEIQSARDHMYNLTIYSVSLEDEGQYKCQINTRPPLTEVSQLTVNIPPIIVRHTPKLIDADLHENVTLNCTATGKPQPIVTWTKVGGKLPGGASFFKGDLLVFTNLHGEHNGVYECTADNGVQNPVKETTRLHIEHAPLLRSNNQMTQYTGRREDASLVCAFEANPPANVTWYKEGQPAITKETGNRAVTLRAEDNVEVSVMTVYGVKEMDLGNYTCIVANSLGRVEAAFDLSGLAKAPEVSSSTHGRYSSIYTLTWSVTSYEPPTSYQIVIKTHSEEEDESEVGVNDTEEREWSEVNVPADRQTGGQTEEHKEIHINQYKLEGLTPSQAYEVKVRAENHFGFGEFSEPFIFETNEDGFTPPPPSPAEPWSKVQVSYTYNDDLTSGSTRGLVRGTWSAIVVHVVIGVVSLVWAGL